MISEEVHRFEYKYYISYLDYVILKERISPVMDRDRNACADGVYHVRSLYFDNMTNQAYHDKIDGLINRQKLRLRMYNNDKHVIKLELKEKLNDVVKKTSTHIDVETARTSVSDPSLIKQKKLPSRLSYFLEKELYRPVVIVEYDREAFMLDFNNIRITFDTHLRKKEHNMDFFARDIAFDPMPDSEMIILEVKFNNALPAHIRSLLTFNTTNRLAISKYCFSRELIY